jgi:hypothetical protein
MRPLPPIRARATSYEEARAALLRRLIVRHQPGGGPRPFERLRAADGSDWTVAYADAWGVLAEIVSFYEERIVNEAFLPTARLQDSRTRLYHSLGHAFGPNVTATTVLAFHLSRTAAGVEAVTRARRAGAGAGPGEQPAAPPGPQDEAQATFAASEAAALPAAPLLFPPAGVQAAAGTLPPAAALGEQTQVPALAQVRAVPGPDGNAPTFVTLDNLNAHVAASRIAVAIATVASAPALQPSTTQLELAGVRTSLAVGQPILIAARALSWIRVLTSVNADQERGSTRLGWDEPLGAQAAQAVSPTVYAFATSTPLLGATAQPWASLTPAARLATTAVDGSPLPVRGGVARSADDGATWVRDSAGLPAGAPLSAVWASGSTVIVAAGGAGIFRSSGGAPFAPTVINGPSWFVTCLGGAGARLLAGGTNGIVWQSLDDGRTWSPVTGGALAVGSDGLQTNRIPAVVVRCVAAAGAATLLAGTDGGIYSYTAGNWTLRSGPDTVFDLLVTDATLYAATSGGVSTTPAANPSAPWPDPTGDAAYAFARIGETVYVGTDDGVTTLSVPAPAGLPANTRVTALTAHGSTLFAATSRGLYTCTPPHDWQRADGPRAFTVPAAALDPTTPEGTPPAALIVALAALGIVVGPHAKLSGGHEHFTLEDGTTTFELTRSGGWHVRLRDALSDVAGLASGDDVYAVCGPLTALAGDWPGFAVGGNAVAVAPPPPDLAPGQPAVIEQRATGTLVADPLDVTSVAHDTATQFGAQTKVARIGLAQPLPLDRYPRSATTVWSGAQELPLATRPPAAPRPVQGARIELAEPLAAPIAPGRLISVAGAPIGLAVAPLGGALRVSAGAGGTVGPVQCDVESIAFDASGDAYLATSEGVFSVSAPGAAPVALSAGWPVESDRSVSSSRAVVLAGGSVLAATSRGVWRWGEAWEHAGVTDAIAALATDGTRVVAATAAHEVWRCDDVGGTWVSLGSPGAVSSLALGEAGTVYAATSTGVSARGSTGGWAPLGDGLAKEAVTALLAAGGVLWAGSATGTHTYEGGEWHADPSFGHTVSALGLNAAGNVVAAGPDGVFFHAGGTWSTAAGPPGVAPAAVAAAPDGSYWLALPAVAPVTAVTPLTLRDTTVFTQVPLDARDAAALDQGSVPGTLIDAFAEHAEALDTKRLVVTGSQQAGFWLLRSGAVLHVLALRGGTVNATRCRTTAYPTGRPRTAGRTELWPVEVNGVAGTLRAPASAIHRLAAGPGAPALAETTQVRAVTPDAIELDPPLAHVYDPATVQINLNVVTAAQGKPTTMPLGTGDGSAHQRFPVRTPVASIGPTARRPGKAVESSLRVFVDHEEWATRAALHDAAPGDHVCAVRANPDGTASVTFGDGRHGARVPAGSTVVASYLQGGGPAGEAAPGALLQPVDRPQLVSQVHNPQAALVPPVADPGAAWLARTRTLDRVVTLSDYEDVAAAQAGVASASAELVNGPTGRVIVITVARASKAPSDLVAHVTAALGDTGAVGLEVRVVLARTVRVAARIELVTRDGADRVRAALARVSAERPGTPLPAARVLSAAMAVRGVLSVRIAAWGRVDGAAREASSLHAAAAAWPAGSPGPVGAELLVVDGHSLELATEGPA